MKTKLSYYHLEVSALDTSEMAREARGVAECTWLCPGCRFPKPGATSIDVELDRRGPVNAPVDFVYGFGVPIAEKALIDCFGREAIERDLHLGKVSVLGSGVLDEWVSVRPRRVVTIRGTKQVSHRRCPVCGRLLYFAMGARYLFPAPPPEHEIFERSGDSLVISQRLFDQLPQGKWSNLTCRRVAVLDAPKDGLGVLE
jgi:hypothetical protein